MQNVCSWGKTMSKRVSKRPPGVSIKVQQLLCNRYGSFPCFSEDLPIEHVEKEALMTTFIESDVLTQLLSYFDVQVHWVQLMTKL